MFELARDTHSNMCVCDIHCQQLTNHAICVTRRVVKGVRALSPWLLEECVSMVFKQAGVRRTHASRHVPGAAGSSRLLAREHTYVCERHLLVSVSCGRWCRVVELAGNAHGDAHDDQRCACGRDGESEYLDMLLLIYVSGGHKEPRSNAVYTSSLFPGHWHVLPRVSPEIV